MPDSIAYYVNFSASDALYEDGGPLAGSGQVDAMQLGPYLDHVDVTYEWIRIGHDGDPVAVFADGVWKVGLERIPQGGSVWRTAASPNALIFSDFAVTARLRDSEPRREADDATQGVFLELSTAHISKATNDLLFANAVRVPDEPTELPSHSPIRASVYRTGYGFFIRVPVDFGDEASAFDGLPADLAALLQEAQAAGAGYLVLDADGPVSERFRTYQW